jgi:hypothetical protein
MGKKREKKELKLEFIKNLMKETGSSRVNASEIARQFGCDEKAVRLDLQEIYKEMNEKSKESVGVELVKIDAGLRRGMRELEKIIESDKQPEAKVKAIETYSKMASDYIAGKSRLGIFRADGKQTEAVPIICFNHRTTNMEDFLEYCKNEGHPEVKNLYEKFEHLTADKIIKDRLEREQRLHPHKNIQIEKETIFVDDASDLREAVNHGLSVGAIKKAMLEDVTDDFGCKPDEYWCGLCKTCHKKGDICFNKIKKLTSEGKSTNVGF